MKIQVVTLAILGLAIASGSFIEYEVKNNLKSKYVSDFNFNANSADLNLQPVIGVVA